MPVLIIAGSGRGAGKTAVGCAMISALPQFHWKAYKLSPHEHDQDIAPLSKDATLDKDTARYLGAGAEQSLLFHASHLDQLLDKLRTDKSQSAFLLESNQIAPAELLSTKQSVLCLAVLANAPDTWKSSIWARSADADALVLTGGLTSDKLPLALRNRTIFIPAKNQWGPPELIEFVRHRFRQEQI